MTESHAEAAAQTLRTDLVGIVVVSHSRPLARAAVELASEMVQADSRPTIRIAAGLDEHTLGTDAAAVSSAVEELSGCPGILVLVDLGSSILSAEMAGEFLGPEVSAKMRISPAPLVEGLLVAAITASTGVDLEAVASEAARALEPKQKQIG
ncbi:dihydroxyacetone kinase phosphoryl donor subunit DhaM [Acidipropionibacterium virtanenii]|uniref:phosphoenolpyruvate--glycerone phosphotransferase n=1 Tax=Acidipropionibacterium virtanenii TaxID=2057246 RepID=A0A344US09_9ACTN|nr:dihydroxyacetone kinase phosphoryl donor subunit DhaM [Acidipropionibacterium virtanenii]AXE38057.1 Protein-lysine deacetylase [Acidipropionibacterium virtanenii]